MVLVVEIHLPMQEVQETLGPWVGKIPQRMPECLSKAQKYVPRHIKLFCFPYCSFQDMKGSIH